MKFSWVLLLFAAFAAGCSTLKSENIELRDAPQDDRPYFLALEKATRSADIYRNFETDYKIQATLFSPEFKEALRERHKKLMLSDSSAFEETSTKLGFLVSIFAPDSNTIELANKTHWTVLASSGSNHDLQPIMMRKIEDKTRWKNYFHYLNKWTQEWLIVFDIPTVNPDAGKLVEAQKTTLTLATGDVKTTLTW